MRTMYDGITAADVPGTGWAVAGYSDGRWPDYPQLVLRYAHLEHVSICTTAAHTGALVLDVETGDATPEEAPGWTTRARTAGIAYPWVYMNEATWPLVKAAFAAQKVAPPLYWVANYDWDPTIPAGAIAKQHTNTPGYDISSVADYVPGIDPAPLPQEADMQQTDTLAGYDAPAKITVGDVLADMENLRHYLYGQPTTNPPAAGSPLVALIQGVAAIQKTLGGDAAVLQSITAEVNQLDAVDATAVAAALASNAAFIQAVGAAAASHIPVPPTAAQIAQAVASLIGTDLKAQAG